VYGINKIRFGLVGLYLRMTITGSRWKRRRLRIGCENMPVKKCTGIVGAMVVGKFSDK
jgi:hypothetical protein